jgi:hypothetical protein
MHIVKEVHLYQIKIQTNHVIRKITRAVLLNEIT